jgi:AcrR family transcriptional regulator
MNATAHKILLAAQQLFMQRGYRAVSVTDIVSAAEVTKPTLYYHFADKEEVFVQVSLHMLAEMHARLDAIAGQHSTTAARLTAVAAWILSSSAINSRMMRQEARQHLSSAQQQRLAEAFRDHMLGPLSMIMEAGIRAGDLQRYSANELAILFLLVLEGFHHQSSRRDGAQEELLPGAVRTFGADDIVGLFLQGVGGASQRAPD